jgi:hypothetical protein
VSSWLHAVVGGAYGVGMELMPRALAVITRTSISVAVVDGLVVSPHVGS